MKAFKKRFLPFLLALIFVLSSALTVSAATENGGIQDGLRAVLKTDKDVYKANEKISLGVSLKNESNKSIENIEIVVKAPEGLNIESGSLKWKGITLGAGESKNSDPIVMVTKKDEGTSQTPSGSTNNSANGSAGSSTDQPSEVYPAPSGKENQSTQSASTGDSSQILLWGMLAVLSGAGLVIWFCKKSGKHLLTLLLILAVSGGMIPAMPAEAATDRKSFSVTKDITVDGKSYTLEAVISYNIEKEEPVAQVNEIYVATNGNDTAAGTKEAPVQTLERARTLAREVKKNGLATVVYLRGGDYVLSDTFTLGAEDSGTKDAPVTYRAYPGEEVIITGSKGYDFSKFQKVDRAMKELLPTADAKEKVVVADVSELGMTPTEVGVTSDSYAVTADLMMLDQHNMKLSRYPNSMSNAGWIEGSVLSPDKTYGTKPTFKINDDRVWSWSYGTEDFVYLGYFDNGWGATFVKGTMDAANKEVKATTPASWGSSYGKKPVQIYNVYEAMDEPGEWFYDKTTGKLYLYPYEDTTENSKLYVAESNFDLVSIKNAAYINIEGITVKSSAKSGIVMDQVESCVVNNCKLLNFQGRAVDIDHAENSGVKNSDIAYVRGDIIFINGGDYKTFSGGKNFVSNNRIHDTNQLRWFQTAVTIRGVETKIDHNEFFNITETAVGFGGHSYPDYASVNTMIEYNVFHDCCVNGKDYGVVYAIGDARCQGTVIQYNYFYNIGNESTAYKTDSSAIYADGGLTGLTIKNNIMGPGCSWQTEFARLNGGINHVVENNLTIDAPSLFVNFMYDNFETQYLTGDGGCGIKETTQEVLASDIYKEKYEWIKKAANGESFYVNNKILNNVAVYIDAEPHTEQSGKDNSDPYHAVVPEKVDGIGKNGDTDTNLYICKSENLSFETSVPLKDYGKTDNRDLFVDYENGDYRLIDEVLKDTAFENIDQSGMGLQFFTYDGKSCLPGGYAPEVSNVRLSQTPKAGEEIAAVYDFTDADGDGDLATYANFYISETAEEDFYLNLKKVSDNTATKKFVVTEECEGMYIRCKVAPVDTEGIEGAAVWSAPVYVECTTTRDFTTLNELITEAERLLAQHQNETDDVKIREVELLTEKVANAKAVVAKADKASNYMIKAAEEELSNAINRFKINVEDAASDVTPISIQSMIADEENWAKSSSTKPSFVNGQLSIGGTGTSSQTIRYTGQQYKDTLFSFKFKVDHVADTTNNQWAAISLLQQSKDAPWEPRGLLIVMKEDAVEVQSRGEGSPKITTCTGNYLKPGTEQNMVVGMYDVSTTDVRIIVKIDDTTLFDQIITDSVLLSSKNYFGGYVSTGDLKLTLGEESSIINVNTLIQDKTNWTTAGDATMKIKDGQLTIGANGITNAGSLVTYTGKKYAGKLFNFKAKFDIVPNTPSQTAMVYLSSSAETDLWNVEDAIFANLTRTDAQLYYRKNGKNNAVASTTYATDAYMKPGETYQMTWGVEKVDDTNARILLKIADTELLSCSVTGDDAAALLASEYYFGARINSASNRTGTTFMLGDYVKDLEPESLNEAIADKDNWTTTNGATVEFKNAQLKLGGDGVDATKRPTITYTGKTYNENPLSFKYIFDNGGAAAQNVYFYLKSNAEESAWDVPGVILQASRTDMILTYRDDQGTSHELDKLHYNADVFFKPGKSYDMIFGTQRLDEHTVKVMVRIDGEKIFEKVVESDYLAKTGLYFSADLLSANSTLTLGDYVKDPDPVNPDNPDPDCPTAVEPYSLSEALADSTKWNVSGDGQIEAVEGGLKLSGTTSTADTARPKMLYSNQTFSDKPVKLKFTFDNQSQPAQNAYFYLCSGTNADPWVSTSVILVATRTDMVLSYSGNGATKTDVASRHYLNTDDYLKPGKEYEMVFGMQKVNDQEVKLIVTIDGTEIFNETVVDSTLAAADYYFAADISSKATLVLK